MLGLYLHVPFCSAICNYCNFNRGLLNGDLKARYVDALVTEISRSSARHDSRRSADFPRPDLARMRRIAVCAAPAALPDAECALELCDLAAIKGMPQRL